MAKVITKLVFALSLGIAMGAGAQNLDMSGLVNQNLAFDQQMDQFAVQIAQQWYNDRQAWRAATGYYGYYTFMNGMSELVALNRNIGEIHSKQNEAPNGSPALYVFAIDLSNGQLATSSDSPLSAKTRAYLVNELTVSAQEPLPAAGYIVRHALIDGDQRSFIAARTEVDKRVIGFEADRGWQTRTLQALFDENTLLPASLAGGVVSNDRIYLRMQDSAGATLFEAGTPTTDSAIARVELSDEYGGVFRGHSIVAAIDPVLAGTLIIGGLPKSRLPVLLTAIVLAIGLLIAAIWQLHRENSVIRMRSNFVAEVSHELRTPLTQIRMFAETLLLDRSRSDDERRRALSIINRESQRLGHMVDNVLRFSEGEQARETLTLSRQPIAPFLASVVDEFRIIADATGTSIETRLDETVEVNIDPDALRQIMLKIPLH